MGKKKLILSTGLISVCLLVAAPVFYFTETNTKANQYLDPKNYQQRIENAKQDVEKIEKNPEEESTVIVSFDGFKNTEFIKNVIKGHNLKTKAMYHAFKGKQVHMGGYVLNDGESIDDALANYENDIKNAVKTQIEIMQKNVIEFERKVARGGRGGTDEKVSEDQKALAALKIALDDLQQQHDRITNNGLELYGLRVMGKNKDIVELARNPSVIAIDKITKEKEKWNPILYIRGAQ